MRITRQFVEARVRTVNTLLNFDVDNLQYNTVGSIQLYHGSGAYQIHRVANEAHGVSCLMHGGTLRDASEFLAGMIEALRIARDS